jgi:hypothetical protein
MKKISTALTLFLACSAFATSACDPTATDPAEINYIARIMYPDDGDCKSAVGSQAINWTQCHQFRHDMDNHGVPITATYGAYGYRPIRAFVNLRYLRYNLSGAAVVCDERTVQTDLEGNLRVPLEPCGGTGTGPRAVVGRVYLQYAIMSADHAKRGYVRTLWEHDRADDIFPLTGDDVVQDGHGFGVRQEDGSRINYSVPELVFKTDLTGAETVGTLETPAIINGGTQIFLRNAESGSDEFGYMRQVLSAHNTIVELQERLRANYAAAGREAEYFDKVYFSDARYASLMHYNVWLNANWAFGFRGGISLYRPDLAVFSEDGNEDGNPDGARVFGISRLLSHTDMLSHEFGHSVHAGLAGGSWNSDYRFANPMKTLSAVDYDWGHGGSQLQEMGAAFGEGIANTFGQFMMNQCNGSVASRRPQTNVEPWNAGMWSGNVSCDTNDQNACSAHHIRYHLMLRGLENGGTVYNQRLALLQALAAAGTSGGRHSAVTSNNEFRYGEFGCDLLDTDSDVTHAGASQGATYFTDYTYIVNRIFNGYDETPVIGTYAATLAPESVQITIQQLFDAAGAFCPTCSTLTTDLTSDAYASTRVKAIGGSQQSPQSLSAYIVSQGWATDAQMRNLLQSNYMENNY